MIRILTISVLCITSVQLTGCSAKKTNDEAQLPITPFSTENYEYVEGIYGAKAGLYSSRLLSGPLGYTLSKKPSAPLGVFVSTYIAQGIFSNFTSGLTGITAQMKLIAGQKEVTTEEVFSLMTEYGSLLQVDVPDMLNRSTDRERSLDEYTDTLKNFTLLMERKATEMKTSEDDLEAQRRTEKKAVQAAERDVKLDFKNEQFESAAKKQEELAQLKSALTKTETQLEQIDDMRERFADLVKVGKQRITAIDANRRIILADLEVVNVPGIEEFNLIQD